MATAFQRAPCLTSCQKGHAEHEIQLDTYALNLPPVISNFSISSTNITQWKMKAGLVDLIAIEKPEVLCIQETMLPKQSNFNLNNYNGIFKEGNTNFQTLGGIAIFIYENIPLPKFDT